MSLSLKPRHLLRYRDVARIFFKYGRGDLLKGAGLDDLAEVGDGRPGARPRSATDRDGMAVGHPAADERCERAADLAADLEAMGPTFIKVGQFLSTRADLLPLPYLDALARLQDRVEAFPFADVERTVSEELGIRLSKAFRSFEETPVAAASLGQVHRAELWTGAVVAVKVQRPGIREQVLGDLEALREIAAFLDRHTELGRRQDFTAMVEEFRKSLLRELDYREEAKHLVTLDANLAGLPAVIVPRPVDDYVGSRVLTMEFIHGRKVTSIGPLARTEFDGAPLTEQLCRAYLQQILVDGFFHADPHPGNVFLTDDGRIALIDLGMVAQVPPHLQEQLLKLVLAISEGRAEDASDVAIHVSRPLDGADEAFVRRRVVEMVMDFQGLKLKQIALGRLMFETARVAAEGGYRMPRELAMLSKALLNLDEVARRLDPEFDLNASIRHNASDILRQRMMRSLSPGKLLVSMLEVKEFVEKLPARLNGLIDALVANRLSVKVDAIDEVLLMEGLQKIANRITLGLVISALIMGASLLMRIDTPWRILGYPALPMLFFVAAALCGVALAFNIFHNDMRLRRERRRHLQRHPGSPR